MYRVPAIELPTPPPDSPTGAGVPVKKVQLRPATPRDTTSQSSESSGTSATASARPQRAVMK